MLARALRSPAVNAALRVGLRPLAPLVPAQQIARVPVVGTVRVRLPGGADLRLDSDGRDVVAAALYWRGLRGFEPETVELFLSLLAGARTVLDVGANVGLFALLAGLDDQRRSVFAFEPVPETFERLRRNIHLNGLLRVEPVAAAVGARDGVVELHVPPGEALPLGASTLEGFREPGRRLAVSAITLDRFAAERGLAHVDLLKVDTEGTEPEVLTGARALLERDRPWIVCEVLHGLTEDGLHAVLGPLGYRYFAIGSRGPVERSRIAGDPSYRDRNWLFAPRERALVPRTGPTQR
jgi:FkbM family methyltransferase